MTYLSRPIDVLEPKSFRTAVSVTDSGLLLFA
jgi:hypothetical protein